MPGWLLANLNRTLKIYEFAAHRSPFYAVTDLALKHQKKAFGIRNIGPSDIT